MSEDLERLQAELDALRKRYVAMGSDIIRLTNRVRMMRNKERKKMKAL